jgi:hypothetical protein
MIEVLLTAEEVKTLQGVLNADIKRRGDNMAAKTKAANFPGNPENTKRVREIVKHLEDRQNLLLSVLNKLA